MKRHLRIIWTCSDFVHHEHRWKWTAWLCGRWQRIWHNVKASPERWATKEYYPFDEDHPPYVNQLSNELTKEQMNASWAKPDNKPVEQVERDGDFLL